MEELDCCRKDADNGGAVIVTVVPRAAIELDDDFTSDRDVAELEETLVITVGDCTVERELKGPVSG